MRTPMDRDMLMIWKGLYAEASVDTTPRLDPLRGTRLHPPYYGVSPLDHLSVGLPLHPEDRKDLAAQILKREEELQGMRAFLNASAPINQLPTELFVEILSHLQSESDEEAWPDVLRVCRHWFVIGSTAATLWRNLKARGSTNFLRTGLARSRSADLSVETVDTTRYFLPEVPGLLTPHLYRLRELNLGTLPSEGLPAFQSFMENEMPALRSLQVTVSITEDFSNTTLALPPSRFPLLQELTLGGIQIFNDLAIAPQLRTVDIRNCWGQIPALTTATLRDAVRQMRHLRHLFLRDVYVCDGGIAPTVPAADKVAVDQLEAIHLHTVGQLISSLLCALVIPPTATASFVETWQTPPPPTYVHTSFPADRTCLPVLSKLVAARVLSAYGWQALEGYTALDPRSSGLGRGHSDLEFVIDMPNMIQDPVVHSPSFSLDGLTDIFRDAPLRSLYIETVSSVAATVEWRAIFVAFPALCVLEINVVEEDEDPDAPAPRPSAKTVFSALEPGTPAHANSDAALLCPNLGCLRLAGLAVGDSETLLEAIGQCLASRERVLDRPDGRPRIEEITLDLVGHHNEEHFLAAKAAFEEAFAFYAKTVVYRTHDFDPDPGPPWAAYLAN